MSLLDIYVLGSPVLRQETSPVAKVTDDLRRLIDDMFDTMREYQGVGLAAPQIHESVRLFVAGFAKDASADDEEDDPDDRDVPLMALINPEITPIGREQVEDWEGCLSIPDIRGRVPRARQISVKAYDRTGKRIEMKVSGFTARVIQHETDHLDGVLFFDRMTRFDTLTFLEEFGRYWSRRDIPEE